MGFEYEAADFDKHFRDAHHAGSARMQGPGASA